MKMNRFMNVKMMGLFAGIALLFQQVANVDAAEPDPRDDASPWAMGSSAETSGSYPKFNPLLEQAGVRWVRLFGEWQGIEPKQGQWNWEGTDKLVANVRENHLHLTGGWWYFAPWASADGGTRRGPIKDMKFWRDYITASVERYKGDIKYWEVWNEFNGSFYVGKDKPKEYADLVVAAYDAAKKADPTAQIGLSVANFDVGFLDATIKAGAANHFDFVCVHPYENLFAAMDGGEVGYLSMAGSVRKMLAANRQRADMPLWITEIGGGAPAQPNPEKDAKQAEMVAKAYLLSIAQGFQKIFWFEARGMADRSGEDFGLIRHDWTVRPSYVALKTLTTQLGPEPRSIGWLDVGGGGYGFMYQGANGPVLATWAPLEKEAKAKDVKTKFSGAVTVVDLTGKKTPLAAGAELALTRTPVLVTGLPAALVQQAQANAAKPYPWGGDYAHAQQVTCKLGVANVDDGLTQRNPQTTTVINDLVGSWRSPDFNNPKLHGEGRYVYFRADPQFAPFGTTNLEMTVVVRRIAPGKAASFGLMYESLKGYKGAPKRYAIPADDQWHEAVWTVNDANFVGQWGMNFRLDANGSPNSFYIKEARVKKLAAAPK
ncbi:MAG: endo-1,4-beta-xylanase [Lentisphaeria bacterium]